MAIGKASVTPAGVFCQEARRTKLRPPRSLISGGSGVVSEPSTGHLLLYVAFIVIAMAVLDGFEAKRMRPHRRRPARQERRPPDSRREAA
jgi:hypothetical protein